VIAKDTGHRIGSLSIGSRRRRGFSQAAEYIASKAKEYGPNRCRSKRFLRRPEDLLHAPNQTPGWEAERAELWETEPRKTKIADVGEMRVALADYSRRADVTGSLVEVGAGTRPKRTTMGKRSRADRACGRRRSRQFTSWLRRATRAGVLSYQQNQVTGWSGDYVDNVRWGHLSPYQRGQ